MFKVKLIKEWRDAKRWFSVHAMLWASVIQIVWVQLPDDFKSVVPSKYVSYLTAVLLVLGIGGRLVNQEKVKNDQNQESTS